MLSNSSKVAGGLSLDSLMERTSDLSVKDLTAKAADITAKTISNNPFLPVDSATNGGKIEGYLG